MPVPMQHKPMANAAPIKAAAKASSEVFPVAAWVWLVKRNIMEDTAKTANNATFHTNAFFPLDLVRGPRLYKKTGRIAHNGNKIIKII
jgi:hypothetical protein